MRILFGLLIATLGGVGMGYGLGYYAAIERTTRNARPQWDSQFVGAGAATFGIDAPTGRREATVAAPSLPSSSPPQPVNPAPGGLPR